MKPRLEILDDFLAEAEGLRRDHTVDPTIYRRWWADNDRTHIDVFAVDSVGRLVAAVVNTVTDPSGMPWLEVTHHEADRVALILQAAGVLRYPADDAEAEVERLRQNADMQARALGEVRGEVKRLQALEEGMRDLADQLDQDAADDEADANPLHYTPDEVARLSSLVKVQRRIAKDLRNLLADDPGAGKTSAEATR